jgi:hypothetical protein
VETPKRYGRRSATQYRVLAVVALGYRLTEFAYLAATSKATRAGKLAFPCKPDRYLLGSYRIATGEVLRRVTMQFFVREHGTVIAAPVQCDVDGIPKGSHCISVTPTG